MNHYLELPKNVPHATGSVDYTPSNSRAGALLGKGGRKKNTDRRKSFANRDLPP